MNISAYQYIDFDSTNLAPKQPISLNSSGEVYINVFVDNEDEPDKVFAVEMQGPSVGDGINRVNVTIIDNERKCHKPRK